MRAKSFSSFREEHPALAQQLLQSNNPLIDLENGVFGKEKIYWECSKGHVWQAAVHNRIKGSGCPFCSGYYAIPGETDAATLYPIVAELWDKQNNERDLRTIKAKSGGSYSWLCPKCHTSWVSDVSAVTRLVEPCPVCSGRLIVPGKNDLMTVAPELKEKWDFDLNEDDPTQIDFRKVKKYWWKCTAGHSWQEIVRTIRTGGRCRVCANIDLWPGFNDLASASDLASTLWDYKLNSQDPSQVIVNSKDIVNWLCTKGHRWQASVRSQVKKGVHCSFCSGNRVFRSGVTDLATVRPDLLGDLDPDLNSGFDPTQVSASSMNKVAWKCQKCGYRWEAKVHSRAMKGRGCASCARHVVHPGRNDLASNWPELLLELHPTKNEVIDATKIGESSAQKLWWKCSKGHEWETVVYSRTKQGTGCLHCSSNVSKIESMFFEAFEPRLLKAQNNKRITFDTLSGERYFKPDISGEIFDKKIIVEYDGSYWHRHCQDIDREKTEIFLSAGYVVIRIREGSLEPLLVDHPNYKDFSFTPTVPYNPSLVKLKTDEILSYLEGLK